MSISSVLTDIEGTTTDIRFVHDVLFPYARQRMSEFVRSNAMKPHISKELTAIRERIKLPDATLETLIETLLNWIDEDQKITPLKNLQGHIWTSGYQQKDFQGHVYPDAARTLRAWYDAGISLNIFSSGSVHAQRLLFGHSTFGDLTPLFNAYFDTTIGMKKCASAYTNIANAMNTPPQAVLFLSDVIAELDAARDAGMHTGLLVRDAPPKDATNAAFPHKQFTSFEEIDLKAFSCPNESS